MKALDSTDLARAITEAAPLMRVLGLSKVVALPTNTMFFATGNQLVVDGDLRRRTLMCKLDAGMERPSERRFGFDPPVQATERRVKYVVASLTIMRAYWAAGRPGGGKETGSFKEWARMVRDPLMWLGEADAWLTVDAGDLDPECEQFAMVLAGWQKVIGLRHPATLKQVRVSEASAARYQVQGIHRCCMTLSKQSAHLWCGWRVPWMLGGWANGCAGGKGGC